MNLNDCYVACICEGSAEHAIMDLLLDADKLILLKSIHEYKRISNIPKGEHTLLDLLK